jgi:signal transduction histidine kinase
MQTDPGKLRQILLNLLTNAVKFTDEGSVTLSAEEADRDSIAFRVQDTGIGIAPEHQARIFDAFRQVQQTMTRRVGGAGLGLTVARQRAAGLQDYRAVGKAKVMSTSLLPKLPPSPPAATARYWRPSAPR